MRRRLVPPPSWPRVVGAWALLLPGVVAFQPTFGGPAGYLASAVGVTLGAGIALAAVGLGWSIALWALALLAAYFLVGGPLALPDTTVLGVLPSLETLRELALLIPFGWRDLLTVATPAGDFAGPAAVPLLAGLLAGTVAVGLARATRAVFLPLLVAPCWLAFAIAFGVRAAPTAVWLGAALGAGILAWATAHRLAAHRSASAQFLVRREKGVSRPTLKVVAAAALIMPRPAPIFVHGTEGSAVQFSDLTRTTGSDVLVADLGGQVNGKAAPVISGKKGDHLKVFVNGPGKRLWVKTWDGGWSDWTQLPTTVISGPGCAAEKSGDVFWCADVEGNGAVKMVRLDAGDL